MTQNKLPKDWRTVNISADGRALLVIDQTKLPGEVVWRRLASIDQVWLAIKQLVVRGAPAIGVAAAGGLAVAAGAIQAADYEDFWRQFEAMREYLAGVRPTAVNLRWALERLRQVAAAGRGIELAELKGRLLAEARAIAEEDVACCRAIGEAGLPLISGCRGVLTHCNAGRLAAVQYGTALAPIYLAAERGEAPAVFADETRPLLQGARLTAWELAEAGIDVTVICDNMAASVLSQGKVDAVIVGADRIAANGDAANKIGTLGLAVLARHFNVPFYIAAPGSTVDLRCPAGADIVIEEREPEEVRSLWFRQPMAAAGAHIYNPAFDVTPHELISAIITERGVLRAPYDISLREAFGV